MIEEALNLSLGKMYPEWNTQKREECLCALGNLVFIEQTTQSQLRTKEIQLCQSVLQCLRQIACFLIF